MGRPKGAKNKKTVRAEKKNIPVKKVIPPKRVKVITTDDDAWEVEENVKAISPEEKQSIIDEYIKENPPVELSETDIDNYIKIGVDKFVNELDEQDKMIIQIRPETKNILSAKLDLIQKRYGGEFNTGMLEKIVVESVERFLDTL